jgi:hypothetical protein
MKKIFTVFFFLICISGYTQIIPPPNSYVCPGGLLFDWEDVSGALSYRIQVLTGSTVVLDVSELTSSQYFLPAGILQANTIYYWRINVTWASGNTWSPYNFFYTLAPLPPIPTVCPVNGGNPIYPNNPIIFYWRHALNATSYRIQVSVSPSMQNPAINQVVTDTFLIVPPGTFNYYTLYYWRISASDSCGESPFSLIWSFTTLGPSAVRNISGEIPESNKLYYNYPNPFNPSTCIRFDIPKSAFIKISVFDISGREVAVIVNESMQAGRYEAIWNGSGYSNGIYFYKISAGSYTETKKMILMK